jgi:hypothetical protein
MPFLRRFEFVLATLSGSAPYNSGLENFGFGHDSCDATLVELHLQNARNAVGDQPIQRLLGYLSLGIAHPAPLLYQVLPTLSSLDLFRVGTFPRPSRSHQ